jgi:tripartite ATP-independent transporter DctM subunit
MLAVIVIALVIAFLVVGAGLAYVSGAAATLAFMASDHGAYLAIMPQRIFSSLDVFAFMAMPLFILVGEIMNKGGVTRALVDFAMALIGRLRGGLGYVNILTSLFFAGISGSAMADAAALSSTLVPAMRERGYSASYAGALTAAASILGPIIPPSIILLFYGAIMGVDVAALFAAGIAPGLTLAVALMIANTFFARRLNHPGGRPEDIIPLWPAFRRAAPALALPIIIMGGIVFGWMTPTEASAVAAIVAIAIGYWYRELTAAALWHSVCRAAILSGSIFIMLAAASGINFLAALTQFPLELSHLVSGFHLTGLKYLLLLTALLLVVGALFEVQIALALVVPILAPVAIAQGANPVHIGVVICLTLSLGLIMPPVGGSLIVVSSVTGVGFWRLVRATLPFLLIEIAVLLIIVLCPELTLAIPRRMGLL